MLGDKIAGKNLLYASFRCNGLKQADASGRVGLEQILVDISRFFDDFRDGISCQLLVDGSRITLQAIQNTLDIPGVSVETIVNRIESRTREFAVL